MTAPTTPVRRPPRRRTATLSPNDKHITDRFSFGFGDTMLADVRRAGGGLGWFEWQLALSADPAADRVTAEEWWPYLMKSAPDQWSDHRQGVHLNWQGANDFVSLTLTRRILAVRQVHEVLAEFWANHLYVPSGEERSQPWRMDYENLIRRHALGNFVDLLTEAAVHPAMTGWLTNAQNTKWAPNENLGRELLELHTVGAGSGYTEVDVKNSARILTGYKLDLFKTFVAEYRPSDHFTGQVAVMGFTASNVDPDGRAVTQAYLRYLALHPATATHLSRKLCERFVSDEPDPRVVEAVATAYTNSSGDIKTCLRALVRHPSFWVARGAKVRDSAHDLVAAARAVGARPSKPTAEASKSFSSHLQWWSSGSGYRPYGWPRPDGPPTDSGSWTSASRLLTSWSVRFGMSEDQWRSQDVVRRASNASLPSVWPQTAGSVVDCVSQVTLGVRPTRDEALAACEVIGLTPNSLLNSASQLGDTSVNRMRAALLVSPRHLRY